MREVRGAAACHGEGVARCMCANQRTSLTMLCHSMRPLC